MFQQELQWMDIALLYLIVRYNRENQKPPKQDTLYLYSGNSGLLNDWIEEQGVTPIHSLKMTSGKQFSNAILRLRQLGFLVESDKPIQYIPTDKGEAFLASIGDDWQVWPVRIPISGNNLLLKNAERIPAL